MWILKLNLLLFLFGIPSYSDYSSDLLLAFANSQVSHQRNKNRVDVAKRHVILGEGQLVYIENGSKLNCSKLNKICIGPFKISRRLSNTIYEIDVGNRSSSDIRLYHISKIIPVETLSSSYHRDDGHCAA